MKSHIITLIIALVVGYIGGSSSQFINSQPSGINQTDTYIDTGFDNTTPLDSQNQNLVRQFAQLEQKINSLESQLKALSSQTTDNESSAIKPAITNKARLNRPVSPNKENLLLAGVNSDIADDILRRISQQEFKRLELQNLIQRGGSSSQQYRQELRELNRNRISLRSELGDDTYDQYLYSSGQNNRVKVTSVMAGSPAESSGFQSDDVILYYDDRKILSWPDIRSATIQGEIGSYTNIEILRDGTRMNLMVPRGTLGVQLDAIQLDPAD